MISSVQVNQASKVHVQVHQSSSISTAAGTTTADTSELVQQPPFSVFEGQVLEIIRRTVTSTVQESTAYDEERVKCEWVPRWKGQ